jgi:hypothetical protein
MFMKKPKNNVSNLLAAIQRKAPSPLAAEAPKSEDGGVKKAKLGSAVQFWLHDQDRLLIRELSAWLAGQGQRPTDSMVIRAALRMAKPGQGLLEAYRESSKLDGRIKRD